jgi:hypothetical protein
MIGKTILQPRVIKQDDNFSSMDGDKNLLGKVFRNFLDNLIREYAAHSNNAYNLFACNLPYEEKKQFLSYLTIIEDYEYFTSNPTRERIALTEYESEMQYLIDDRIDEIYHEDMREMGLTLSCHKDNGECFYYKS